MSKWRVNTEGDVMLMVFATSLSDCPVKTVAGSLVVNNNKIKSFEGGPHKVAMNVIAHNNKFVSLEGIHKDLKQVGGYLDISKNFIKSHVLGLLLIEDLKELIVIHRTYGPLPPWGLIINKYLPNRHGMKAVYDCQEALLAVGLEKYAQL